MIDITALHIHYVDFKKKKQIKKIKPSQPDDPRSIQQDVGEVIRKLRDSGKYEYYYVVVEIDRGGKSAYRTVIPKTLF